MTITILLSTTIAVTTAESFFFTKIVYLYILLSRQNFPDRLTLLILLDTLAFYTQYSK